MKRFTEFGSPCGLLEPGHKEAVTRRNWFAAIGAIFFWRPKLHPNAVTDKMLDQYFDDLVIREDEYVRRLKGKKGSGEETVGFVSASAR